MRAQFAVATFLLFATPLFATTLVGPLPQPSDAPSATLLSDGRVLVAGGYANGPLNTAAIYDPSTRTFRPTSSMMTTGHSRPHAILLRDGRVLITAGSGNASAETYNPATESFTATASPSSPHDDAPPVMLSDGRILVAGGSDANQNATALVEIFDPATNSWSPAGNLANARYYHAAELLRDGRVLVIGGTNATGYQNSEIFDPTTGTSVMLSESTFTQPIAVRLDDGRVAVMETDSIFVFDEAAREFHLVRTQVPTSGQSVALLHDGHILLAGGSDSIKGGAANPIFVVDTEAGSLVLADTLQVPRSSGPSVVLNDGTVLIIGGLGTDLKPIASVEVYAGPPRLRAERTHVP